MTKRYSVEFEIHDHCIHDETVREEVLEALDNIKQYEIEGICISRKKMANPWHTGIPTEEGWYLLKIECSNWYNPYYYSTLNIDRDGRWSEDEIDKDDIVAWQKIEPYEGEK